MDTPRTAVETEPPVVDAPAVSMSPWQRTIAIFARPTAAWAGLETRAQWWFPLILNTLVIVGITVALYDRAIVPMLETQWGRMVETGRLPEEQYNRMVEQVSSTGGMINTIIWQAVSWPVICLLIALLIWFGVGFVLGTSLRYRQALEIATWSSLVIIPAQLLGGALGWIRGTMHGVHVGFGALLPDADPPSKLQAFLGSFLDSLGPLQLWPLVVAILGASVLSDVRRKSVAMVLGGLYIAVSLFAAAMAAMFA